MCAIVGIASKNTVTKRDWLAVGRDAMAHRGPDDKGEWWSSDGRVGFGHRRLSILDLSSAGNQPMTSVSGDLTIAFNGEIYNYLELQASLRAKGHIFYSSSDTEVILAAYREWGVDCLSRLNGMFAFAVYDSTKKTLFLVRDRAGEKPLFYSLVHGELRFASELKGLMADPTFSRRVNAKALDIYLTIGYVPGDLCMVAGVKKLAPAHAMLFDLTSGVNRIWCYWTLPAPPSCETEDRLNQGELLSELETLLEDSVRRQMVADVPVGILLSGGVDSSIVTALAVRASNQVRTFTVGFSNFAKYDETEHARLIARHFHTEHTELSADKIYPDIMPKLARQYDEPMADSSMIPTYIISRLVGQHCTVALGGDGGDELFGGYAHYDRLLWTQEKFARIPRPLRKCIAFGAEAMLPLGFKGRNWLESLSSDFDRDVPLIASHFDRTTRRQLMTGVDSSWSLLGEEYLQSLVPEVDDLLQRVTRMDFANYMPEDILVKGDRASMLNSVELRAPMLDYKVIEFAFGRVPSRAKATSKQRKILLKALAAKLLPPAFDQNRKQGFSIPLAAWLKNGPWRDYFKEILLDGQCIFNRKSVLALIRGQDQGRNNQERLFSLVLFELWRREYLATL